MTGEALRGFGNDFKLACTRKLPGSQGPDVLDLAAAFPLHPSKHWGQLSLGAGYDGLGLLDGRP